MYSTAKRFPPSCRFYSQGNCRAGKDCHFAHILPLSNPPIDKVDVKSPTQDFKTVQIAIRNLELDQIEQKYSNCIQNNVEKDYNTLIELLLPLETKESLKVLLIVPHNYPDTQCTLQIQELEMTTQTRSNIQTAFEDYEWHKMKHKTLTHQLDWLINYFNSL